MVTKQQLESLNSTVDVKDIEFRVQTVMKSGERVLAQIICYKDARYDMNILDSAVGAANWQKVYSVAGNMVICGVGINCEGSGWVWKWDAGDPDNEQNKEKALASDSFKRACFNWGIGRELYEWPKIFVELKQDEYEIFNGKPKAKSRLRPRDWNWVVERNDKGGIKSLTATDKNGDIRFNYGSKYNAPPKKEENKSNLTEYWIGELNRAVGKDAVLDVFNRTPSAVKETSEYKKVLSEKKKEIKSNTQNNAKAD